MRILLVLFVSLVIFDLSEASKKNKTNLTNVTTPTNSTLKPAGCGVVGAPAFFIAGNPWKKTELRWKLLTQHMPNLGIGRFRAMLHQSFDDWARFSSLSFHEVNANDKADIELSFVPRYLDPLGRFDGPAGTLAYAYFPPSGVVRFESEERWTESYTDRSSFNFRLVATHEIGHALGLSHSDVRNSIMFAEYQQFEPNDVIKDDDRQGIRFLYGSRFNPTTRATLPPTTTRAHWIPTASRPVWPSATTRKTWNPVTTKRTLPPTTTRAHWIPTASRPVWPSATTRKTWNPVTTKRASPSITKRPYISYITQSTKATTRRPITTTRFITTKKTTKRRVTPRKVTRRPYTVVFIVRNKKKNTKKWTKSRSDRFFTTPRVVPWKDGAFTFPTPPNYNQMENSDTDSSSDDSKIGTLLNRIFDLD